MQELKDLLVRFKNILYLGEYKTRITIDTIREVTGMVIDIKDISIKNTKVYLNIKPIYKNEVFFKKEKIISKLNDFLGQNSISDIV